MLDDATTATWLGPLALLLALAGLAVAVGAQARLTRVRRALVVLRGGGRSADVLDVVARQSEELLEQRRQLDALRERLEGTRADVAASLRHVAVVRFVAPGDAGGRTSFSAALVDDAGNGMLLTSIAGRSESRTVAKSLVGGASEHPLSDEELEAVAAATDRSRGAR
ncbi:DUF4446 family protein [Thalassiella azotivora]